MMVPIHRRALIALFALLALAACGTPATPYAPATEPGGYGISETQLDANTWDVGFSGNRFTTREQVETSVLYRAAEIAAAAGADGFLVLKEEFEKSETYEGTSFSPYGYPYGGSGFYMFRYYGRSPDVLGYRRAFRRPMPPIYLRQVSRYAASARIRLFSGEPPPDLGTPFNAQEVLTNLRPLIAPPPQPPSG